MNGDTTKKTSNRLLFLTQLWYLGNTNHEQSNMPP